MANWSGSLPVADPRFRPIAALAALSLAVAGCSEAPPYRPPQPANIAAFKEAGAWLPVRPGQDGPPDYWWTLFGDQTLDRLEEQSQAANPTIARAVADYDAAQAYLGRARADLVPTIDLAAAGSSNRQATDRPLRGRNQPDTYGSFSIGPQLTWEVDLWGRVRNNVRARQAEVTASADDLAAVRLSLATDLAADYVALRGLDQQIALLQSTVKAFADADALNRRRFTGGIASALDTGRSGALLGEAEAGLEATRASRAVVDHAIAALVGEPASTFVVPPATAALVAPDVPLVLPSTLALHRPDIAAAERRVFAANAGIGVARAAFFPQLLLGAQGGFDSTSLANLITLPNSFWAIGPTLLVNLFDGGRRRATVRLAEAEWRGATAAYRERALAAFQDVEDCLADVHFATTGLAAQNRAAAQAGEAERVSLERYVKGIVSFLDVATAQETALRIRLDLIRLEQQRLTATVQLMRALGGGWRTTPAGPDHTGPVR